MQLMTQEIRKAAESNFALGSSMEQLVVAKFFTPWAGWTWYLMNTDPDDPDYCWGIVSGLEVEIGSFSLSELQEVKGKSGLKIERDLFFTTRSAQSIWDDLQASKHV